MAKFYHICIEHTELMRTIAALCNEEYRLEHDDMPKHRDDAKALANDERLLNDTVAAKEQLVAALREDNEHSTMIMDCNELSFIWRVLLGKIEDIYSRIGAHPDKATDADYANLKKAKQIYDRISIAICGN